jgi:hypothetical protein
MQIAYLPANWLPNNEIACHKRTTEQNLSVGHSGEDTLLLS